MFLHSCSSMEMQKNSDEVTLVAAKKKATKKKTVKKTVKKTAKKK